MLPIFSPCRQKKACRWGRRETSRQRRQSEWWRGSWQRWCCLSETRFCKYTLCYMKQASHSSIITGGCGVWCWYKVEPLWIIGVLKLLPAQPSPAQLTAQPRDIEKQFQFWEMKDETRKVEAGSSVLCPVLLQHSNISGMVVMYDCIPVTIINSFLMFGPWTELHQ